MTTTQEAPRKQGRLASLTSVLPSIGSHSRSLLAAHVAVDWYAAMVPSILGLLEVHCHLRPSQTAWLFGIGSLSSGLSQPLCAWLSDRYDWRGFGGLGVMLAAVFICLIGAATNFGTLLPIYVVGMFGVGMFHPIAAASMGALCERRQSMNLSLFFIFGMAGGVLGATFTPRLIAWTGGFSVLALGIVPGLILAWLLHRTIRCLPHRHPSHRMVSFLRSEIKARWTLVGLLYVASVLRFAVNLAAVYLYVRWVQNFVRAEHAGWTPSEIANFAAPIVGNLNACLILGMALGGMGSGFFIRQGQERWPLVLCPVVFAPAVFLFPHANLAGSYVLSILIGIGFAAMIPVSIGLGQRLLPHRTSLASSFMMGGAWAVAMLGPRLAEFGIQHMGIATTFYWAGAVLCLAGLVLLPLHAFSRDLFSPPVVQQ